MLILVGLLRHKGRVDCGAEDVVVLNNSSRKPFFQDRRPVVAAICSLPLLDLLSFHR